MKDRQMNRRRRALLSAVIALTVSSVAVAAAASASTAKSGPKGLFKVNGHRLYLSCKGSGKPTVVLDPGLGGDSATWAFMTPLMGGLKARVCVYDRYQLGRSAGAGGEVIKTRTIDQSASDLHALLRKAKLKPPYVFVAASIAGLIDRELARRFPGDVAGLVMLDTAPDDWDLFTGTRTFDFGHESLNVRAASAALRAHDSLDAKPVIVVEAGFDGDISSTWAPKQSTSDFVSYWNAAQRSLSRISSNSIFVFATKCSHELPQSAPSLAVEAVRLVENAARSRGELPACADTALPAKGGDCNGAQTVAPSLWGLAP
jgi:hypothetical protein